MGTLDPSYTYVYPTHLTPYQSMSTSRGPQRGFVSKHYSLDALSALGSRISRRPNRDWPPADVLPRKRPAKHPSKKRVRQASEVRVGTNVRKYWKGEDAAFEGRVVRVEETGDGTRAVEVAYGDGDRVVHRTSDSSYEGDEWEVLQGEPEHEGSVWNGVAPAAVSFAKRHMEIHLHDKIKRFLQGRRQGKLSMSSITIKEWTSDDHLFFFGSLEDISCKDDADLVRLLSPVKAQLPFKRVGRSKESDLRFVCCAPAVIHRTKHSTVVGFGFTLHRLVGNQWENQWDAAIESMLPKRGRRKQGVVNEKK